MFDIKDRRVMQIGYVVRDIEKNTEDYSKRLGIGPWDIYTFCAPYEIGNNGKIRPPERRLG